MQNYTTYQQKCRRLSSVNAVLNRIYFLFLALLVVLINTFPAFLQLNRLTISHLFKRDKRPPSM